MLDDDSGTLEASNGTDDDGNHPTSGDQFRIGSITKVFTAVATLALVEDGLIDLDTAASTYVSRVEIPEGVRARDLLQHTSGILDSGPMWVLTESPERAWSPEAIIDASSAPATGRPGADYRYENSNYLLLGVLLEEVTGLPYHVVIRDRIIGPLDLADTYLAHHEEGGTPFDPYTRRSAESFDYTSIATISWSAGALISSAPDLHRFFSALLDGQIIPPDLVEAMTANDEYLGLLRWDPSLVGHSGLTPGYSTWVVHQPTTGVTLFLASTDDFASVTSASRTMLQGLSLLEHDE